MPCASANCGVRNWKWTYGMYPVGNGVFSGGTWVLVSDCNASGEDYICSGSASPPPGPASGSCGGAFAAYHAWVCDSPFKVPGVDCQNSGPHEILGTGLGCFDVACTCVDSGNCGEANCGPTETCCDGTTCVATDSFQTDNNRCGDCNTVCEAGYICVDGACVIDCAANSCTWTWTGEALGCCQTYTCTESGWVLTSSTSTSENCSTGDSSCCDPGNVTCVGATYNVWNGSGPCTCGNVFLRCGGASVNEPGWQPPPPPYAWIVDTNTPNNSCAAGCASPVVGTACNNYGDGQEEPCNSSGGGGGGGGGGSWAQTATCPQDCACTGEAPTISGTYDGETVSHECTGDCACEEGDGPPDPDPDCDTPAPASVTKQPEMMPNLGPSIADGPCSQEECEAHVSTWMAEASGKPNEEGLYKVKWILLDGCPGACCSDQPTQPEFVKKSTLVDAPCKCGCS